jgi:fucose permease
LSTSSPVRRKILALLSFGGFILLGWNAVLLPSLIGSAERAFRQTDAGFGLFYFLSALLYAGGSFGGGFLVERLGRRGVLIAAAALMALGLTGEALTSVWPLFLLAALFVNGGAGAIDGGLNGLFLDLYQEARGGALNRLHLFFGVGALVAPALVGQLVTFGVNWRALLLATGAGALALAILCASNAMPSGRHTARMDLPAAKPLSRAERSLLPFAGLAVGIGCYVAAEMAISGWLVNALQPVPLATATAVLSVFWFGLSLGRLVSNWVADRFDYAVFTAGCLLLASAALVVAVLVPLLPLAALFYGLAGFFYGPVYPMIMALGGNFYPRRLAALSGSLGAAAVVGSIAYPPLVGLLAGQIGLRAGLVGAGLIGLPGALAIIAANTAVRRLGAADTATAIH